MNQGKADKNASLLPLPPSIKTCWRHYLLTILLLSVLTLNTFAQQTIQGKVIDRQDGAPLAGVSVLVRGTKTGTTTDANGNFVLQAENDATLVFSFVGYQSTEVVAKEAVTVILDEDKQGLDEVVVIGYGTQKKGNITGSIASVNAEQLKERPVA